MNASATGLKRTVLGEQGGRERSSKTESEPASESVTKIFSSGFSKGISKVFTLNNKKSR